MLLLRNISFLLLLAFPLVIKAQLAITPSAPLTDSTMLPNHITDSSKIQLPTHTTLNTTIKQDTLKNYATEKEEYLRTSSKSFIARQDSLKHLGGYKKKVTTTLKNKLGLKTDSTTTLTSLLIKQTNTKGNVSVGYDYGVIPFIVSSKTPAGFFKTDGNISFEAFKLPLIASFYYADVKNVSGLNNYFRLTFDENKFKENLNKQISGKEYAVKEDLKKLYEERQKIEQKLLYLKTVQSLPKFKIPTDTSLLGNIPTLPTLPKIPTNSGDSLKLPSANIPGAIPDSLKNNTKTITTFPKFSTDTLTKLTTPASATNLEIDSTKIKKQLIDSLPSNYKQYINTADSINRKVKEYEAQAKAIKDKIDKAEKTIKAFQSPNANQNPLTKTPKVQTLLSYVKKLEVGLCYPNYSTFLINGTAVRGLNMELQKDNTFFAFTYGKTINNLLVSNNIVQNNLQNVRNLYNFFDFNNVKESRRVAAFKLGYGSNDANHIHVGLLYGVGLSSYITPTDVVGATALKEKNYVLELDGKYIINSNNSVEATYGKSSVQQEGVDYPDGEKGLIGGLLNTNVRSNVGLIKFNALIPKTKTKVTALSRIVDPFFKSYGVGFMRSDNIRYEFKLEQPITRKIKIGASYRKDQDNILNMFLIKTTLQTIGTSLTYKVTKRLTLRASYNPVLQTIRSKDNSIHLTNKNYISNIIVTWNPKIKKISSSFNALYNYYQLYDGVKNNIYQNYSLNNVTTVKAFKNEFSASTFYANNLDTLNGATLLVTNALTYPIKKCSITAGGKWAKNKQFNNQFGYKLKINMPVSKYLSLEFSGEKIVIGDFYNSYSTLIVNINKFPYYCQGKLIINW
ncbi:MAG: hypothetical protein H7331_07735 [Bacteroidia bacterium]|nr:hypothetical protein [Bacteroidia bacterium]